MLSAAIQEILDDRLANLETELSVVFVLRGLPGSGKSTLRTEIMEYCELNGMTCSVSSADQWFYRGGTYEWKFAELDVAHAHSRGTFLYYIHEEKPDVIVVDNTNLVDNDYKYYVDQATGYWYDPFVVEFHVESKEEADFLANRSLHLKERASSYDAWKKWGKFVPHPEAIILRPPGLSAPAPSN